MIVSVSLLSGRTVSCPKIPAENTRRRDTCTKERFRKRPKKGCQGIETVYEAGDSIQLLAHTLAMHPCA